MNYSAEFKESIIRRMLPPNNESISKIAREEGLSEQTLRNWKDKARAQGIDLEPIMRKVIFQQGVDSGKAEAKKFDEVTPKTYGHYFCTKDYNETFEKKILVEEDDHFECSLNYCPLVAAWQKLGLSDEDCAKLCDIAMEGDRGSAEGLGLDFELKSSLACGDDCCHLVYRKK